MSENQNKHRNRRRYTLKRKGYPNNSNIITANNGKNNNLPKMRELKFYMHDSVQRKQSESFGKIKEAIITKIQKTFDDSVDLVASLENNVKKIYIEPVIDEAATIGTDAQKARMDRLAEKKWEMLFIRYQDKVEKFDHLWIKAYAFIWDNYCSKDLQVAIREMPDFNTAVNKEPLVLLERIEELMHTPERAKYPVLTTVEVLSNFLKCKQSEKESLIDYLSRFKSERDVVYRIMGKKIY